MNEPLYRIALWTGRDTIHVVVAGCISVAQAGAVAMDQLGWPWTFGQRIQEAGAFILLHNWGT